MSAMPIWGRWIGWLLIGVSIALAMDIVPAFIAQSKLVFSQTQGNGVDARLTDVRPEKQAWLVEQNGGRWGRYGWYLAAGEQGSLRIELPGRHPGILKLRLWAFSPGHLSVSVKGPSSSEEVSVHTLDGRVLQVLVNGPTELAIVASSELSQEQLVLDRFAVDWFPSDSQLPSLWPFVGVITLGFGGCALWVQQHRNQSQDWSLWFGCAGILIAASIGFALRWTLFDIVRGLPADPDAVMYFSYAHSFKWFTQDHGFYSGNFMEREPLHVAALNLWFRLWGDNFPAMMLYTVCLSTLLVIASGLFIWCLTEQWLLGLFASWIVAVSPAWIDEAVRGLRLESLSLLLLAVLGTWIWGRGWRGAILLGILTGFMALVQSPALGIVLPLIWLGWLLNLWRERRGRVPLRPHQWRWSHLGLVSLLAVALFLPHLYGLYKVHGDPSWPSYGYARWNANMEFPDRIGTAGFPSAEELERDPYAGPRITYGEYLLGMHSVPKLLYGHIKGWIESFAYMSVSHTPKLKSLVFLNQASGFPAVLRHLNAVTLVVFVLSLFLTVWGWVDLWRWPQYWWVPFLSLWGTWYAAYLYSARVIEPFRHTGHVYPLLLFCLLWGSVQVYQRLRGRLLVDGRLPSVSTLSKAVDKKSVRKFESGTSHPE